MTDATVNIPTAAFRPGTSDAEIEAAAAKAAVHRRHTGTLWRRHVWPESGQGASSNAPSMSAK